MLRNYKVILWDFDGVIMDSMPIRDKGFEEVLKSFPQEQVEMLLNYHRENGGLSRYVKFRYFFEHIRKQTISEQEILEFSNKFSEIMLSLLINEQLLINDSLNFIRNNWMNFQMHIVSGSDEQELNTICKALNIAHYFTSIKGSPQNKIANVSNIINENNYYKSDVVLIGDSLNDLDAANINSIKFIGYNNNALIQISSSYILKFSELEYNGFNYA